VVMHSDFPYDRANDGMLWRNAPVLSPPTA
jgi:hypothetical protein